jgi:hypothetical protein
MNIVKHVVILGFLICTVAQAQDIGEIVENIYQRTVVQEALLDNLGNYSHVQKVHFTKLDGDEEIDEESKREFQVNVRSSDLRHRELISASEFKDGQWSDITVEEKSKKMKAQTRSQKFSLGEMVGPEERGKYQFRLVGEDFLKGHETIHLYVEPLEDEEESFKGDLWFDKTDYNLIQAKLIPSEFPTGVENMMMEFYLEKYGQLWLPVKINFEAEISFLFIFRGRIISEILFEDYKFDQSFNDSVIIH